MGFLAHDLATPAEAVGPAIEWEEPDCLLCGRHNWIPLVESLDTIPGGSGLWFAVVQCQECGLCFTNPRPSLSTIGQFYPIDYSPHRAPRKRKSSRRPWLFRWRSVRRRREQQILGAGANGRGEPAGRRLLDFGCGGGSFLARMHRQEWQVTGVDVSTAAVQRVRHELGLRALVGTLPHPDLPKSSFDVITMWHSLEHVHAPLDVLREARRLLVPGGRLIIAVPNIDSLPFRWFGSAWYGLDLPRHLTHFAPWTLQLMLQKAGFRVGPMHLLRHSDWLRSSAQLACQRGQPKFWNRCLTIKFFARLAASYCSLTKQSDCILLAAER